MASRSSAGSICSFDLMGRDLKGALKRARQYKSGYASPRSTVRWIKCPTGQESLARQHANAGKEKARRKIYSPVGTGTGALIRERRRAAKLKLRQNSECDESQSGRQS